MADDSLTTPVIIQATRIDATLLPRNIFSQPYTLYVIQQGTDLGNVAGKANEAGQGAWDAQVKNDEQDLVLANHEVRIEAAEQTLINHEQRITAAEATLVNHEARITANEAELANHEIRITQNTTDIAALTVRMVTAESAITSLQANVATLTTRVTTAEGNITTLQTNLTALTMRVTTAEGNITTLQTNVTALQSAVTTIQGDYVSKSATTNQIVQAGGGSLIVGSVASPTTDKLQVGGSINVSVSYKVAGTQVLSARQTGWTAATGTAYKGAFDGNQAWTIGILNVLQIQQIADALTQARQRIKALEDMARTHGMIN